MIKRFSEFTKSHSEIMEEKSHRFANRIKRDGLFVGNSRIDGSSIYRLGDNVWKLTSRGVQKVASIEEMVNHAQNSSFGDRQAIMRDLATFDLVAEPGFTHPSLLNLADDMPNQNLGYPTSKMPTLSEFMKKEKLSDVLASGNTTGRNAWMTRYANCHSLNE